MNDNGYYLEYLKKTDKFPQSIYHAAKHDMIKEVLEHIPTGSFILDAGCGIGNMTGKYCATYSIVGIDEQLSAVQYCRKFYHGTYMQASLYDIPFSDSTFDAVLFLDAIEHFTRPIDALKELARVLKPGGLILVCTMNYASLLWFILENTWHRFFGGTCKPYSKNVHPTQYTPSILRRHCEGLFEEIYRKTRIMNMEIFYLGKKMGGRKK